MISLPCLLDWWEIGSTELNLTHFRIYMKHSWKSAHFSFIINLFSDLDTELCVKHSEHCGTSGY